MGIEFILLFLIGLAVMASGDVIWLMFVIVYGVDGRAMIIHRLQLNEPLGEAHRKHAFQIMANELGLSHVVVSLIYMGLQLVISLVMVYLVPASWHLVYLQAVLAALIVACYAFMKKYYHLHAEYLKRVGK